jgi:NAD(P)-dependent dehydrogenase (short-subunit alcohol dehydrogenase family)
VRVDHTREDEVTALAARVRDEAGRLDVLVTDIWGCRGSAVSSASITPAGSSTRHRRGAK